SHTRFTDEETLFSHRPATLPAGTPCPITPILLILRAFRIDRSNRNTRPRLWPGRCFLLIYHTAARDGGSSRIGKPGCGLWKLWDWAPSNPAGSNAPMTGIIFLA